MTPGGSGASYDRHFYFSRPFIGQAHFASDFMVIKASWKLFDQKSRRLTDWFRKTKCNFQGVDCPQPQYGLHPKERRGQH
jgi:hypothetical protein